MIDAFEVATDSYLDGQTFADENIFLLVENLNTNGNLNDTVLSLAEEIRTTTKITLKTFEEIVDIHIPSGTTIAAAYRTHDVLYFVTRGHGSILLKRAHKSAKIIDKNATASGKFLIHDIFILAGKSLFETLPLKHLLSLAAGTSSDKFQSILATRLEEQASEKGVLCLVLTVRDTAIKPLQVSPGEKFGPIRSRVTQSTSTFLSKLPHQSKRQRLTLAIGIMLFITLAVSIVFGNRERERATIHQTYEQIKQEILPKLTEGETLAPLSPEQARPVLEQVEQKLTESSTRFKADSEERKGIDELLSRTKQAFNIARRIFILSEVPLYFDINWVKEGGKGERITLSETALSILDPENKSLYTVSVPQKKPEIAVTNDVLSQATFVTSNEVPYVFLKDQQSIIDTKLQPVVSKEEGWGTIVDFSSYGGNFYLLDTSGKVLKFPRTESGFGAGQNWIGVEQHVDFSEAQALAIDGYVWILKPNDVLKFASGYQEPFFLKGESITSGKRLWVSQTGKKLYILEENRIIAFEKDGTYQEQYVWEGLQDVADFTVSEKLNKILVSIGDKIYSIDLQ